MSVRIDNSRKDNTCQMVQSRLLDLLDGGLLSNEHEQVTLHLANCSGCSAVLASLRSSELALRESMLAIPPVGDLHPEFLSRIRAEKVNEPKRLPRFAGGLAFACIAATCWMVFTSSQHSSAPVHTLNVTPGQTELVVQPKASQPAPERTAQGNPMAGLHEPQSQVEDHVAQSGSNRHRRIAMVIAGERFTGNSRVVKATSGRVSHGSGLRRSPAAADLPGRADTTLAAGAVATQLPLSEEAQPMQEKRLFASNSPAAETFRLRVEDDVRGFTSEALSSGGANATLSTAVSNNTRVSIIMDTDSSVSGKE